MNHKGKISTISRIIIPIFSHFNEELPCRRFMTIES